VKRVIVNQIKIGALLGYISLIVSTLANILLTPFMLYHLGASDYGLYMLIGSFVGYLAIFDFGIGNAVVRYVAKYRAENKKREEENFLALSLIFYCLLSILVLIIGTIIFFNFHRIFGRSLTPGEVETGKIMFAITVANLVLTFPLSLFSSIMSGYERFILPRLLNILRVFVRVAVLYVLLEAGFKAVSIVMVDTILNILIMLINVLYVLFKLNVTIRFHRFDSPLLKEVFAYSFFVFLNLVVDQIFWRTGQIVLGLVASTASVAIFSIGMQFVNYYMQFSTAISGVFLPRTTQMVVNNASGNELTDLLIKTGRIQLAVLGYVLIGFGLLGNDFLVLWVGAGYTDAWIIAFMIMIPGTVPLFQNIAISILQAKNRHSFRSIVYLIVAVANIFISVWLAKKFGLIGPAIGIVITALVGNILVINLYYHFIIGLNIFRFFRELAKGLFPALSISVLFGLFILFIPGTSWGMFILKGILYSILYFAVVWFKGLNSSEKKMFADYLPCKMNS